MNLGERIKQLRTERNLTQPQLAEAIGIEQSYLSKLENDKSVPSADIFQAILRAFCVDVPAFLAGIDTQIVHRQLRQIPDVANHLNADVAARIHNMKRWLYGSAVACILGLSSIVAGYQGLIFPNKLYNYMSPGVVLSGEATDVFSTYEGLLFNRLAGGQIDNAERIRLVEAFRKRFNTQNLVLDEYRGQGFSLPVKGGSRVYDYKGDSYVQRSQNRYLLLLGTVFAVAGVFGFIVESRLRSVRMI